NSKQLDQVPAEDCFLLSVAQERRIEDEIDTNGPVKRVVGSVKDVIHADLVHEVPEPRLVEDHRVDIEVLPEILTRLFLERLAVGAAGSSAERIGAATVRRQVTAGVGRADLQPREPVERAFKNQVRE